MSNIQAAVDLWISDPTTAEATYGNISNWDTSCVTDMSGLFLNKTMFNDDISQWDVSNVTNMISMFSNATSFNNDIGNWNVTNVTTMQLMFAATSFNQDISNWDVSNVTNMRTMFYDTPFNQDIRGWDVSNVNDMFEMFNEASTFNQNLGDWNVSSVTNMNAMLSGSGISTANYDAILQGWAVQTVQNNVILGAGGLFYCNAEAERQSLIDNFGWTFGGDAIDPNCGDAVISCGDYVIEPFCAGPEGLIFENCSSSSNDPNCNDTAINGPDYACLFSQPYPSWFYLQIDDPGDLNFEIVQNTEFDENGNPIGMGLDVDFIAWGPFAEGDNLCDPSLLQPFNEADCSYSAAPIENVTIPNAQTGELYVLLITNYNQSAGFIKLAQTNTGDPGAGSTNCEIITTCSIEIDGGDQKFV